jgi:hypothetical protein
MPEETQGRSSQQELPQREAGGAKSEHLRLSAHPAADNPTFRTEPGPEALPPATIEGTFRPINDRGPDTSAPSQHTRETASDKQAAREEES